MYYAHSGKSPDKTTWQALNLHLHNTAVKAKEFSCDFGLGEVAYVAGLLHDAGKYSTPFQQKLDGVNKTVDHSTAGAKIAAGQYKGLGKLMAYAICGHHGGLPNGIDAGFSGRTSLGARLEKQPDPIDGFWIEIALPDTLNSQLDPKKMSRNVGFTLSFYARMLFSSLVDADYLDTEAFYSPKYSEARKGWLNLENLAETYFKNLVSMQSEAEDTPVNQYRKTVYENCISAASLPKGLFTLTVPTGGGKTLSSMSFALRHALIHEMKRIIYAIPFTSIIEQNAEVFRKKLGDLAVLEHHSNFEFEDDDGLARLSAANWDAPIVVTTNVQLFESLFSNKPSCCRKLHNVANSVIILDEAQTIPDALLKPCLAALQCLTINFGATVVICTATQPALGKQWPDPAEVREIIAEPKNLYDAFRKVDVHNLGPVQDSVLAERIMSHTQVLCIVNTRKHARKLFDLLPNEEESLYHLSALMCPVHRSEVLESIRKRLKTGLPCRVISTQLIEAGVDVDFPVVYRAAAGIDSIAQAAGRCNREGRLPIGQTYVFSPEEGLPKGWFQRMAALGAEVINSGMDPLGIEAVRQFFSQRYMDAGTNGLDKHEILRAFNDGLDHLDFPFEQVAQEFAFIESAGKLVIIPYDSFCKAKIDEAEFSDNPWRFARFFQKYAVTVYPYEFEQLMRRSLLRQVGKAFTVLDTDELSYKKVYDEKKGLNVEPEMEVLAV